ncbi:MAG: HAMP domain-containing histidine kinase [Anaerolineae bacterium]|nr:HAMP domain-containing histidine kinase [Anaerolineae bacterium]
MNNVISELSKSLQKQPKWLLILITLLLMILICIIDYVTGPYISTSILYLVPVSLAAWWIDRTSGLVISLISAILWLMTDIATNPTGLSPFVPYWNAAVRLGFFFVVTIAISSLHEARNRQEEMMSFIVHDLRSPLSNIMMSMTFLKQSETLLPATANLVDMSISSSKKMLVQVNSLLDLTQLEQKKLKVVIADVQVNTLMQQAINEVASVADKKQVTLQVEMSAENLCVRADEVLSGRVLVNLLSNAIKFSPENCPVLVQIQTDAAGLRFCIQDSGPGIPAKWQKQVFNKYEQVEARKSGAATGSGLGLAFCKAAVEAQNGRIWLATPDDERGTVICFTLPLAQTK